jgi:hypothetical protein
MSDPSEITVTNADIQSVVRKLEQFKYGLPPGESVGGSAGALRQRR